MPHSFSIDELLEQCVALGASDLHVTVGSPPVVRVRGELKSLEGLGLPATLHELTLKPRGLVLVTGPTGSGKSTTLAALIDEINRTRSDHILTIEDPVEFV